MKSLLLIAGAAYLGYKILEERRPLPPVQFEGSFGSSSEVYPTHASVPFLKLLNKKTADVMLRAFADDYTAPRMIADDKQYGKALKAANSVGAPIAWTQFLVIKNPTEDYNQIAQRTIESLRAADNYVLSGGNDLSELREFSIYNAMRK